MRWTTSRAKPNFTRSFFHRSIILSRHRTTVHNGIICRVYNSFFFLNIFNVKPRLQIYQIFGIKTAVSMLLIFVGIIQFCGNDKAFQIYFFCQRFVFVFHQDIPFVRNNISYKYLKCNM